MINSRILAREVTRGKSKDYVFKGVPANSSIDLEPLPQLLFISSYPPRECGIATYSNDLIKAMKNRFKKSFSLQICALETTCEQHQYFSDVHYKLNTEVSDSYLNLAAAINKNDQIHLVIIQHEFGFFQKNENDFQQFLQQMQKPVMIVYHTVLPQPDENFRKKVRAISQAAQSIVVMTTSSKNILMRDYGLMDDKISVIQHGTHLLRHSDKDSLKQKYGLEGKKVLSTFGLLNEGKSIETTLKALPFIIEKNKEVIFLILGKTHPSVVKNEGESYRSTLVTLVKDLNLESHVRFVNQFLELEILLEYLQLTDIYLFTSTDPNQAVSGTFAYAVSCGCPIISTPIPHAMEVLGNEAGIVIDFKNHFQLEQAVDRLLSDEELRNNVSLSGLQKMASTAWENSAIAHARLFERMCQKRIKIRFDLPEFKLDHLFKITTDFGMIQFSKMNQPDLESGYTLDDNARALIVLCKHFQLTHDDGVIDTLMVYFNFIKYCYQGDGTFLNYVNKDGDFTEQNFSTNLEDSNGRAIWALGYLISMFDQLPDSLYNMGVEAEIMLESALLNSEKIHSTRAMAFIIKGLYFKNMIHLNTYENLLLKTLANRLVQMYRHENDKEWKWFESYLTYANSILPEALLCAWLVTKDPVYKEIAKMTLDFLLSKIFVNNKIHVITNNGWMHKTKKHNTGLNVKGGEQPIDVAYTIIAIKKFFDVFKSEDYSLKLTAAFDWFLGDNHLNQVVYNPCTGGCYDGLEEFNVNLNQGAESTVSYLLARLTLENVKQEQKKVIIQNPVINLDRFQIA